MTEKYDHLPKYGVHGLHTRNVSNKTVQPWTFCEVDGHSPYQKNNVTKQYTFNKSMNKLHENSLGLSSTTNPEPKGQPSHCLLRQT